MSTHELVFRHKRIASTKHRAIFYCRLSLRERMEKRYFRRAKGDTCFPHDANCIPTGLTVVEVLFAMVIILVGLIGVAAMIPFAGRQAEDSYKITQGGAAGESALGVFNSSSIVRPRMDAPWLFISDQGDRSPVNSLNEFYLNEFVSRSSAPNPSPSTPVQIAILQNQVIGMGFCIDPLFWGYQTNFVGSGNFAKTRFPFYNDFMPANYDPLASPATFSTPRLRRVSLFDPSSSASPRWLRLPSAMQLATVSGGDLIQAKPEADKSAAPLRGEYVDGTGALLQSPTASASVSWIATLTPIDETPVILPEMVSVASPSRLAFAPENYNLGVVVFSKRDVRDFNLDPTTGIPATGELPVSERIGFLNDVAGTPNHLSASWNAGSFDILIEADSKVDPKIKIGDWLMLSRNTSVEVEVTFPLNPATDLATRQRHKWYRVIGVSGDNAFPREVRVSGEPWYWTKHERQILIKYGLSPTMPVTAVTLLKNVLQVYERTVNLSMN